MTATTAMRTPLDASNMTELEGWDFGVVKAQNVGSWR